MNKNKKNHALDTLTKLFSSYTELERFARQGGLSFDALMILLWLHQETKCTAGNLSCSLGISASKATRCLEELTSSGLVEESLDSQDLRKCYFKESIKGENIVFEIVDLFGKRSTTKQLTWYSALKHSLNASDTALDHRLTDTAQRLMLVLYLAEGAISIGQLCEASSLPQPRTSMSLKALKAKGLIEERPLENDNRVKNITLTQKGFIVAKAIIAELPIPILNR